MTDIDEKIREQLSAWMDGELPVDEARFLERRLANDPALRLAWERMQLVSACLRGHPVLPLPSNFAARVETALSTAGPVPARRPWLGWAVAASLAALALTLTPRLLENPARDAAVAARTLPVNPVPSPASADLVAVRAEPARPAESMTPTSATAVRVDAVAPVAALVARNDATVSRRESPLPLDAQSPTDFPLVDTGEKKSWPRSPLGASSNDPSMEAYLVRHNQMMADDSLGGFVPYVDVVANGTGDAGTASAEGDDGQ